MGAVFYFYLLAAEHPLYYRTPLHRQQVWVPGRSSHQQPRLSATRGRTAPLLLKGWDKGPEPRQSSGERAGAQPAFTCRTVLVDVNHYMSALL